MKKMSTGKNGFVSFFSGRGFYVALALSLVAIGAAAWIGVNSALNKLGDEIPDIDDNVIPQQKNEWEIPKDNATANPSFEVPKETIKPEPVKVDEGFSLPVKGEIIVEYSGDKVIKSKTLDEWVMHTGIDIKAAEGTEVKSMGSGKVIEVKNDDMWGTCVVIEHSDGVTSHYANLKTAVSVKVNQEVKKGDVIGSVGKTSEIEAAEESHLHFGVKKNGEWVNPTSVAKQ